jgi:hypothetical protein
MRAGEMKKVKLQIIQTQAGKWIMPFKGFFITSICAAFAAIYNKLSKR